ncbi:aspartic proteinase nepenthesin-2-like [Cryptomeria japonica]|uniref:aspartic proteinase nepenthesin-2-like n=1 Tax=Cryptomeria japonica TaxID=3369 RepID=UPI0025AB69D9|nr:aspartic proteinase nepenthesin-2-like [Cryptomeria japonica]
MGRLKCCYVACILALFLLINISAISSSSSRNLFTTPGDKKAVRVEMRRISEGEISFNERLKSAVVRSKSRLQKIDAIVKAATNKTYETPLHVGDGEYLIDLAVGTPSVSFEAIVDTGSDLIWTQCMPCHDCYKQATPIFDPSKSSTFSAVPCNAPLCRALGFQQSGCNPDCSYAYQYSDGSFTNGGLALETLTIGSGSKVPKIAFGCGHDNKGATLIQGGGIVGLGRGPVSLISQMGTQVENKFSYCLLPISDSPSKTSPLYFGHSASLTGAKSVTLIKNPLIQTFWYIPLTGITVNGSAVDIVPGTFDLKADGSGGIVIDSGSTVTSLNDAAYIPLKKAVEAAIDMSPVNGSSTGLDLCYEMPSGPGQLMGLPSFAFNFKGGADYEVGAENLFIEIDGLWCLAFLGSSGDISISILGNIQQQNIHILYDNGHNTLSFKPTDCSSL